MGKSESLDRWVVEETLPPSRQRPRRPSRRMGSGDACHAQTPASKGNQACVPSDGDACHGTVPSTGGVSTRPPKQRGKGVQHLFARARRYRQKLDSGQAKSLRQLGRQEGITGARVCQILNLLDLAPEIVEQVDVPLEQLPSGINVTRLREIAAAPEHAEQLRRFRKSACPD